MSDSHHHGHGDGHDHGFAHIMPVWVLLSVFVALIFLTVVTVMIAGHPAIPPGFDVPIAMTIATMKGLLVVLFFMHVIHDKGLNAILFVFSLVFVALFLGFALTDTDQYQHQVHDFQIENPDASVQ